MNSARHPSLVLRLFSRESPASVFTTMEPRAVLMDSRGSGAARRHPGIPTVSSSTVGSHCSRRLDYRSIVPLSLRTAEDPHAGGPDGENGGFMPASSSDLPGKVDGWAAIPQHLSLRDTADMLYFAGVFIDLISCTQLPPRGHNRNLTRLQISENVDAEHHGEGSGSRARCTRRRGSGRWRRQSSSYQRLWPSPGAGP